MFALLNHLVWFSNALSFEEVEEVIVRNPDGSVDESVNTFTSLTWWYDIPDDTSVSYVGVVMKYAVVLRDIKGLPLKLKQWYKKLITERRSKSFW